MHERPIRTYDQAKAITALIPWHQARGLDLIMNFATQDKLILLVKTPHWRRDTFCVWRHRWLDHHASTEEILTNLREMIEEVHAQITSTSAS